MKIVDIKSTDKDTSIVIEGYCSRKEENKNGAKAILFSIREGENVLYARVKEDNSLYDLAKRIVNGDKITITGELKSAIAAGDKLNFVAPTAIAKAKDSSKQLYRADAKNAFVEFMADAFEIEKLKINFFNYDATKAVGARLADDISIYMDLPEARRFCRKILNGTFTKAIMAEKEKKKANAAYYCSPVFKSLGGISAENLAARGKKRDDGKSLSRSISIEVSTSDKYAFTLIGSSGAGNTSATGLIVPDGKPERVVRIPFTQDMAEEMALTIQDHISGYTASQYGRGN